MLSLGGSHEKRNWELEMDNVRGSIHLNLGAGYGHDGLQCRVTYEATNIKRLNKMNNKMVRIKD